MFPKASVLSISTLLLTLATGCLVGPNYKTPAAPTAPAYAEVPPPGAWTHAQPLDAETKGDWWLVYNDPQLTELELHLTFTNQNLRQATETYLSARQVVQQYRADYYPTLSAGTAASRDRLSLNRPTFVSALSPSQYNDYTVTGQASWEPDFWGRVRRTVEGAKANAQASAADLANVELSVRSELALDYFELRGLDAQQALLDDTLKSFQAALDLTVRRARGGVATESDVALAQTQLATTRTQDIDIAVARKAYQDAIATLIGEPAPDFKLGPMPQTTHVPIVPPGLPSELLERRPDIAGAERRAQAANAQIGVQIAAFYPNISITGSGGFESGQPGTVLQGPSELWSLGASAVEVLFDAGRRRALTEEARHNYLSTVASYRQTVLGGFQEVEDNLGTLVVLDQEAVSADAATKSAQRSLTLSTNRYKGGVTTYLEVLTAQQAQLANQRTQADITTRQFAASVQLIRAIGGGWDTSKLPKL